MDAVENAVEDEVDDELDDEIEEARFEALCASLPRNDPDTTEIPVFYTNVPQFGPRLGEALQGNRHVSSMKLDLSNLFAFGMEGTESVALLLRYIRESEAMRKVALHSTGYDQFVIATHARPLFLAIAESPCIEYLNLRSVPRVPPEATALILRAKQSLKSLSMRLGPHENSWTAAERELLAEAFGANQTLESLELSIATINDTVEYVLRQLGSHPRLRELELVSYGIQGSMSISQIKALTYFLRSTTSLEHLKFDDFRFFKECMEGVVDGLHSNQSLAKLSLWEIEFRSEATDVFLTFMQKGDFRSSIRELRIGGSILCIFEATIVASMLTMSDENQGAGSSIGSSLQVLEYNLDFSGICDALAANASRIRLRCLRCTKAVNNPTIEALNRCLPKLVYLEELDIPLVFHSLVNRDNRSRDFADALRNNGSLQRVTIVRR